MVRLAISLLAAPLPWALKRPLLRLAFGYELHPEARIGLSLVMPRKALKMGAGANIGHFNVIRNLDHLELGEQAKIGSFNWVTAIPIDPDSPVLDAFPERRTELRLGDCAGFSTRHYVDCTDAVTFEDHAVMGGLRCTLLAHHIDIHRGRQGCGPIYVGRQSFISTNCVVLGGARLPDYAILAAGAVLIEAHEETHRLYAGSPAREVKRYEEDVAFFHRVGPRTY